MRGIALTRPPLKDGKTSNMAKKVTSAKVASKASKALQDGRSSARTKSIAGSALSQRERSLHLRRNNVSDVPWEYLTPGHYFTHNNQEMTKYRTAIV